MKYYYVYILTNTYNTVFYIGVSSNLTKRVHEHTSKEVASFTKKYNVSKLIYYEQYTDPVEAITREKQLKNWHREWKLNVIKKENPNLEEIILD